MYDLPLTDAENMAKMADAYLKLTTVLTEKNVSGLITGVEEAREVLKQADDIGAMLDQARKIKAENEAAAADNQVEADKLKNLSAKLNQYDAEIRTREEAVKGVEAKNAKDADINAAEAARLEGWAVDLSEKQSRIAADLDEAKATKDLWNKKLATLNSIPEGE